MFSVGTLHQGCNPGESPSVNVMLATAPKGALRLPMYRLYRLDGAGKIMNAQWIEAGDDEHARNQAREAAAGDSFELWERKRLVARSEDSSR